MCNFANKLWNDGTEESKKQAKDLFAKQRFFSPVLVRGQESEGVKVWGFGKMAYEKLLTIVLDPDYGDITDPDDGNDLKIMYGKPPGASFPRTDISMGTFLKQITLRFSDLKIFFKSLCSLSFNPFLEKKQPIANSSGNAIDNSDFIIFL